MLQKFFKYHGAGNDFLLADNRDGLLSLSAAQISHLCDRHTGFGADGVMLLEKSESRDFRMQFFNPDGSSGMMCGNGGRCIVAFAADLGVVSGNFPVVFEAPDGVHTAVIQSAAKDLSYTIRLNMSDVKGVEHFPQEKSCFLDTGTRHLVKFVVDLHSLDVDKEGWTLRHDPRFAPQGKNVDFVQVVGHELHVRTFEKGVEAETLACGTGVVASAIAACSCGLFGEAGTAGVVKYSVKTALSSMEVEFLPEGEGDSFEASQVWLTGPTTFVGTIECLL